MVSGFISRLVILIFGTLYPAYASYKAVRTKNVKEYVKWMMYWIVFALFTCAETFTDLFLSFWFPFYYEIKIITVIYLLSPATKGSSILYRKFVHPVLTKREQEIDEYIAKAKEQGYHTMLNLGSKGVNYATSLIMQTAIKGLPNLPQTPSSDFLPTKNSDAVDPFELEDDCCSLKDLSDNSKGQGGGGLVNQLRKSYSLSDLREEEDASVTDGGEPQPIRRIQAQNSGQVHPENYGSFYSPVNDFYQRPVDGNREMFFSDEMSSGYSSADNLYFSKRPSKEEVLVRTASLGPSSRIRTRAVTKNGLPKRASLSEEGSTRSALEPLESQNETENFIPPFSHLTSYHSLPSFPPNFAPEYQGMYENVVLSQLFAFIAQQQSHPQVLDNSAAAFQNAFGNNLGYQNIGTSGNHSVRISEVNPDNSCEGNAKVDASDAAGEVQTDSNENINISPLAREKNKEMGKKLTETKTLEEVETAKENFLPSNGLDGQEKLLQKKFGKYKKKPAPTPPTEQSLSQSTSNLIVEDEESAFFTPNASPMPSRKLTITSHDILPGNDNTDNENKSKTLANITGETQKKNKTKKKLIVPKMSFSFWHHKTGKHSSNSDSCSVASVESTPSRSETQSDTEFIIPLRDKDDEKNDESVEEDFRTGIN